MPSRCRRSWECWLTTLRVIPARFDLYFAADLARYAPPLARGLRAPDLVRATLDRYLGGFAGYGMAGYYMFDTPDISSQRLTTLDVYPSLLVSACDYADGTGDRVWLGAHYAELREWLRRSCRRARPVLR